MSRWCSQVSMQAAVLLFTAAASAAQDAPAFAKNHALVIGIDEYRAPWEKLDNAVKDATDVAAFLRQQGFEVIALYGPQATKAAITRAFEDQLPARVGPNDRVFVFFAGHGTTRDGETKQGYLVPVDGSGEYGSMIPMSNLQYYSTALGKARHQLFILDACFGGLAARRGAILDPTVPAYIEAISARKVRQLLTAGGETEYVRDGAPGENGHFTGYLLRALRDGIANSNGDGYITFSELVGYMQPAASTPGQTPLPSFFDGHENGDYWFSDPTYAARARTLQSPGPTPATLDVYDILNRAKQALAGSNLTAARQLFQQAAQLLNAEAMGFLGIMMYDGLGGPPEPSSAIALLEKAAERGDINAMRNLEIIFGRRGEPQNVALWKKRREDAERLNAGLVLVDPESRARPGPALPPERTTVRPMPPTNLTVQ